MNDQARRMRAGQIAIGIFALFFAVGLIFVLEIRSAQMAIWHSSLSTSEQYLWFSRLQTNKSIIALITLLTALIGASYAWRAGQKPE